MGTDWLLDGEAIAEPDLIGGAPGSERYGLACDNVGEGLAEVVVEEMVL